MEQPISLYRSVKDTSSADTITISLFLEAIRSGKWEDQVNKVRTISDEEVRRAEKVKLPNVTVSGVFGKRVDADCKLHSGFIAIDVDGLGNEVEATKQLLARDPYVFAAFMSVSGRGLCVLFRIDPEQHRRAFEGIADYLLRNYQIVIDPTGINVSRARFVSHDPGLHLNEDALTFKKYLPKQKARKIQDTIFVQTEFDEVVKQMAERNISCVDDYRDWRDVGFGLADKFGEAGRQYFHTLSACSEKYEPSICDRQYSHCLRSNQHRGGSKVTIATIYWFAKQAGIQVYGERTRKIAAATSTLKKSGLDAPAIAENLRRFEGITDADEIIKQAFAANTSFATQESLVDNIRTWLRHNYQLRRNEVTRKLENAGKELDEIDVNTMYLDCKVIFEDATFDLFAKILFSRNTPTFNPFTEFFAANQTIPRDPGCIRRLFACLDTPDEAEYFGTKWLVSLIASAYGTHSPLMLILAGEKQGTGKTEFFRRLLPPELSQYYAESKLDAGKDDAILMTQKLIIMDDEMGGKSKKESKHLKELTSKQIFTLREPYGRMNVDLRRLAVLCGTTNDLEILNDLHNRRQIPIEVHGIDHKAYNDICKRTLLMEAWHLYQDGFNWQVGADDMVRLAGSTTKFLEIFSEGELLDKYFKEGSIFMTTTEIKNRLETSSVQKLSLKRLGMELKRRFKRVVNGKLYGYNVEELNIISHPNTSHNDPLPF